MILTEVHLLENWVYQEIGNLAKAKVSCLSLSYWRLSLTHDLDTSKQAALASSRTITNSIYCPLTFQAALDLQFGILHAEDKDYTTVYSCFFEAFENMSAPTMLPPPAAHFCLFSRVKNQKTSTLFLPLNSP